HSAHGRARRRSERRRSQRVYAARLRARQLAVEARRQGAASRDRRDGRSLCASRARCAREGRAEDSGAMRGSSLRRCVTLVSAAAAAVSLMSCTRSKQELAAEHGAVVSKYCTDCHSAAEREGGLVLERPNLADPAAQRAKWEKVIHKLEAGLMPPPGEPRPT